MRAQFLLADWPAISRSPAVCTHWPCSPFSHDSGTARRRAGELVAAFRHADTGRGHSVLHRAAPGGLSTGAAFANGQV